jgi:RES domain
MIEEFAREARADTVLKLASLPNELIDVILLRRGIDPASISEAKEVLADVQIPLTPEEAVAYSFHQPQPGRFGDGQWGVYYSALEEGTCVEEVKYHCRRQFEQQRTGVLPHDRYYHLLNCSFAGSVLVLIGHEGRYPDLVSPTDAGYPFCQP